MVGHPAEYPWSSYCGNALGHSDPIVTPHALYWAVGSDEAQRQLQYRSLNGQVDERSLAQIREATNKAWMLDSDYFKQSIASQLSRRPDRVTKGGDRKSSEFQKLKSGINRVRPH